MIRVVIEAENDGTHFNVVTRTGSVEEATRIAATGTNGSMRRERMRPMAINIDRRRALLALIAVAVLSVGLMALSGAKPALAAEPNFAQAQNLPVGVSPTTVTNEDFNGDGKMDLAAQNFGSNSVSVLLGKGDGTFHPKQDVPVGSGPTAVIGANLNDDGNVDLAVTNQVSRSVSVLLGQGDGTFHPKQDFALGPMGSDPSSVTSADFDGDGNADLAVSNFGSNTLSILLGKGDGTLQEPQHFDAEATNPNQVITADFNGDGNADLATTDIGTEMVKFPGGVAVFLGNGDGTFRYYANPLDVMFCFSVNSGDFNGDGKADLAATGPSSDKVVSVALGNGNGGFQAQRTFGVGPSPTAVTSADFDRDSNDDLAVSNHGSDNVSGLFSNGDGSFQPAQNFAAGDGPIFVTSTDVNADDKADLAVANEISNNVSVLLNQVVDTFSPKVRGVSPADAATGVALGASVEASFSEALDPNSVTDQTFTLTRHGSSNPVAARVLYDNASKRAALYPVSLEADTYYTATIKSGSSGVKDLAGNALVTDKVWTFSTVDTRPPAVPVITSPPNDSVDDDGNFTVSGTAEANSTVELFEGLASRGTDTADSSGNWSVSLTGVGEDSHDYTARARDAAGNTSDPSNILTVDVKIPPRVIRVSPADGVQNVARNTSIEATFSEAMNQSTLDASTFTLTRRGSTTLVEATVSYDEATKTATLAPSTDLETNNTAYTATIEGGPDGARDTAGIALAADKVWTFATVDTTAPQAPVIVSPANDSFDPDGAFTVSGTAENSSTVELLEGESIVATVTASGSGNWSAPLGGIAQGEHSYTARANDAAGNVSGLSDSLKITVDTTAPRVDSTSPVPGEKGVGRAADITVTFSDRMDESTLTTQGLKLVNTATGKRVNSVAVRYDDATRTLELDPFGSSVTPLAKNTKYRVTISTSVKNRAGSPLDQNPGVSGNQPKSWTFTTGSK